MTDDIRVQCITHSGGRDIHGHITGFGGLNADGTRWWLTEVQAIQGMRAGRWRFYVLVVHDKAWVEITTRNGHEYLKTIADNTKADNLLSLPNCP